MVAGLTGALSVHGQVAVGTTSPDASSALDVESTTGGILIPRMNSTQRDAISSPATGLLVFNTTNNGFEYYSGTAWTEIASGSSSVWSADPTNNQILPYQSDGSTARSGNAQFVIKDNGRVGIGTDSPSGHFQVESTGTVNVDIQSGGNGRPQMRFFNGGGYGWNFGVVNPGSATMSDGFVIRDINSGQDRFKVSTSGYFGMAIDPYTTGDRLRVNGSVGASAFNTTSDARLKSNVEHLNEVIETINKLKPVSYTKLNESGLEEGRDSVMEYGFLAQDVREILPELVSGHETDSTYLALNYTSFIPLLTRGFQEQNELIISQQEQIDALVARLNKLDGGNLEEVNASASFSYAWGLALLGLAALVFTLSKTPALRK